TRSLSAPIPPATLPDGVRIRAFRPGQDEDAWLRLNARAFASHPEQGALSATDLAERMAEPWFDPAGFLLAERADPGGVGGVVPPAVRGARGVGGVVPPDVRGARGVGGVVPPTTLLGFHWTKEHGDGLGEVYVLGVDPEAGGGGLGRALLTAGLHHLADRGNTTVQLYVEADSRAVRLYTAHGFTVASRDVMYAQT
ncbi:MAG: GNAT family N-acetyltransferase, partial [Actinomycetes bacterium]